MSPLPTAFASAGPWLILGGVLIVSLLMAIGVLVLARRAIQALARLVTGVPRRVVG